MSEKYKIFPDGLYFVTMTTVGWMDVFTRSEYCDEIIKSLNFCIANKGLKIFTFCISQSYSHDCTKELKRHEAQPRAYEE